MGCDGAAATPAKPAKWLKIGSKKIYSEIYNDLKSRKNIVLCNCFLILFFLLISEFLFNLRSSSLQWRPTNGFWKNLVLKVI
jgi:hypothetical protein